MTAFAECRVQHPTNEDYFCKRVKDHDGVHQAYTFSIIKPDEWVDGSDHVEVYTGPAPGKGVDIAPLSPEIAEKITELQGFFDGDPDMSGEPELYDAAGVDDPPF